MYWLFILGIITLAVYHPGFRKLLLWGLGIGATFLLFIAFR